MVLEDLFARPHRGASRLHRSRSFAQAHPRLRSSKPTEVSAKTILPDRASFRCQTSNELTRAMSEFHSNAKTALASECVSADAGIQLRTLKFEKATCCCVSRVFQILIKPRNHFWVRTGHPEEHGDCRCATAEVPARDPALILRLAIGSDHPVNFRERRESRQRSRLLLHCVIGHFLATRWRAIDRCRCCDADHRGENRNRIR